MTAETDARTDSGAVETPSAGAPQETSRSAVCVRALILAAIGLVAGAVAAKSITAIGDVFSLPEELAALGRGAIPGAEDQRRIAAGNAVLQSRHMALWLGTAAAILGGSFGLTLGLFRRSGAALLRGLTLGAALAGVCGAGAGLLAVSMDRWHHAHLPKGELAVSDVRIMLMHGVAWFVIGAGCGLGAGLGAVTGRGRTACGGMFVVALAGALGGAIYPVLAGLALPLADPSLPLPDVGTARLLWFCLPAALMGLVLGRKG